MNRCICGGKLKELSKFKNRYACTECGRIVYPQRGGL